MTRPYRSGLRAEQVESTRERIIEALAEQLGDGVEDFSIPRVAERAGVSVRTVYHHFPNREAQIEAVASWVDLRITAGEPPPTSLEEVVALSERVCRRAYDPGVQHLVRAQLVPGVASLVRRKRKHARERALARVVSSAVGPEAGRLAAAALNVTLGAELGFAMADRFGLEPDQVLEAHTWLIRVVVEAIRRGDVPRAPPA